MSTPQYCNRANIPQNNQNFGHSLRPLFIFFIQSSRGGHGRRKMLMDFHRYGYETAIYTLGAPREEA